MTHTTTPIAPLSPSFRGGLQELLDREDLSWIQNCTASDLDKALLAYRDAVVTLGLERFSRELRELDGRLVDQGVPCSLCGQHMTENRGESHEWDTSIGVLDLRRTYLECREDKVRFFPLDARLKLPAVGRATPMWANALSQLGVELPYEPGQRLVKALTQRDISAKTIDAQVQRDGRTLMRSSWRRPSAYGPTTRRAMPASWIRRSFALWSKGGSCVHRLQGRLSSSRLTAP